MSAFRALILRRLTLPLSKFAYVFEWFADITMEGSYNQEVTHRPPMRGPRGYKPFKNPPQPHMCIQDSIKGTTEKLYINVMSWKQIANTKPSAELIPLYGGMQVNSIVLCLLMKFF